MPLREQAQTPPAAASHEEDAAHPDRGGYLAFVAHEMRNPLSTALWSAELLSRLSPEERAGPRGDKLAGMCLRTLTRLRHLVEDHFLSERLEIQGIPLRLEAIRLAEAVAAAAGRAGVACACDAQDVVVADRAMLERALEGLIAAAARGGAAVSISAAAHGGVVHLQVRGAPPAADAFRPPDRSTPSDPTGRALALRMARAVAGAHGGRLDPAEDGYTLVLPLEEGPPAGEDR